MSTVSRPTSSSSGHSSPSLGRPPRFEKSSSSSSSSFSSSSTSSAEPTSIGVAEVSPRVEVVRGDVSANAIDRSDSLLMDIPADVVGRSGSPLAAIPLEDLSWVDPRVVEISSLYGTELSVAKFFARHPILKAEEYSSYFDVLPCGVAESVCMGRPGVGPPFFYMYACFFKDLYVSLPFDEFTMGCLLYTSPSPRD